MALLESKLEGEAKGREETLLENLRSVTESLNISIEKAMDILKIPEDKRAHLLKFLNQQQG